MDYYFIKRLDSSASFVLHSTLNEIRTRVESGEIRREWLVTKNTPGASYIRFAKFCPSATWIRVEDMLADRLPEAWNDDLEVPPEPRPIETFLRENRRPVAGVLLAVGAILTLFALLRFNSIESQVLRAAGETDTPAVVLIVLGVPCALAGTWMLLKTDQ